MRRQHRIVVSLATPVLRCLSRGLELDPARVDRKFLRLFGVFFYALFSGLK